MAAACAVAVTMIGGCASAPPTPSAAPEFATDAEAFAAAEETYRAYVDALNAVDLSDPATFEDVYAWTTGDANAADRKSLTQMHADGWMVSGDSVFDEFAGKESASRVVVATACLDVSNVALETTDGQSVVPTSRQDRSLVEISFERDSRTSAVKIAAMRTIGSEEC